MPIQKILVGTRPYSLVPAHTQVFLACAQTAEPHVLTVPKSSKTTLLDLASLLSLASTNPTACLDVCRLLLRDRHSVRELSGQPARYRLYFRPIYALYVRAIEIIATAELRKMNDPDLGSGAGSGSGSEGLLVDLAATRDVALLLEAVKFPEGVHAKQTLDTFDAVKVAFDRVVLQQRKSQQQHQHQDQPQHDHQHSHQHDSRRRTQSSGSDLTDSGDTERAHDQQ